MDTPQYRNEDQGQEPPDKNKIGLALLTNDPNSQDRCFTPRALRSGQSLFWSTLDPVHLPDGSSIPIGTPVASIIMGVATPRLGEDLGYSHLLLLRFDSLRDLGLAMPASAQTTNASIKLYAWPIPVPSGGALGWTLTDLTSQRYLVPMTDYWPVGILTDELRTRLEEHRRAAPPPKVYRSWVDDVAVGVKLRVPQEGRQVSFFNMMAGDIEELPLDPNGIRKYFQGRLMDDNDLGVDRLDLHH